MELLQTQDQQPNLQEETLMDFSSLFKSNGIRPNITKQKAKESDKSIITINNIIPRSVTIAQEQMRERRCLDIRRWYCLSRPQYSRTCGISSVVSVWNYLFSNLGTGTLPPISQEAAIISLGLAKENGPHFNDIDFGAFSGNLSLITWFKNLCRLHKVSGRAYYLWKQCGKNSTPGVDREVALQKLEAGLQGDKQAFVYHAYDHYFCPVGYEITPNRGCEAYEPLENINQSDAAHWIIIAEPAKPYPFFTVRKWVDIAQDIELKYPEYMNIRKLEEGVKEYKNPQSDGASMHCLMTFERVDPKPTKAPKDQKQKIAEQDISQEEIQVKSQLISQIKSQCTVDESQNTQEDETTNESQEPILTQPIVEETKSVQDNCIVNIQDKIQDKIYDQLIDQVQVSNEEQTFQLKE